MELGNHKSQLIGWLWIIFVLMTEKRNTVWIFGDSFSWCHKIRQKNNRFSVSEIDKYISDFLSNEIFDSWGEIVSNRLNMNYENHAAFENDNPLNKWLLSSNSNNAMINLVSEYSNKFKKGDHVFLGFTDICRFEMPNDMGFGQAVSPHKGMAPERTDLQTQLLFIRDDNQKYFFLEMMQKLKVLETLSEVVGFNLWYWTHCETTDPLTHIDENDTISKHWILHHAFPNYINFGDFIGLLGAGNIGWETNAVIEDGHLGKIGNKVQGEFISEYLKSL